MQHRSGGLDRFSRTRVRSLMMLFALVLGAALPDRGIYPELLGKVSTALPAGVSASRTWLRQDRAHNLITLYDGDDPVQVYPTGADGHPLAPNDREELRKLVRSNSRIVQGAPPRSEDRDGDGIVDRLDILLGARKLLYNGARYTDRYVSISYPGGDVPRTEGVCTDTVIRALRNAGIDLQKEVHEDILRAPAAYPMVEKVDASINHRRVRTLVVWFQRHFVTLPRGARWLPGDIIFFDTLPERDGPDHVGVVSDRRAENGLPYVINNWAPG